MHVCAAMIEPIRDHGVIALVLIAAAALAAWLVATRRR
jgi:hypothetical protein